MKVVARARQTFRSGRTKAISFRKTQLRALYRFMTEQEAAIKQALYDDLHKVILRKYRMSCYGHTCLKNFSAILFQFFSKLSM